MVSPSPSDDLRSSDISEPSEKLQVAWTSVFVTLFLIVAKLVIGLSTGSLALLSQAADSGFDFIAVLITLLAVRISSIPPDEDHPYGHGKFENLSALIQSIFLLAITGWIAWEAIDHLSGHSPRDVKVNGWSFAVLLVSIGLDFWRARKLQQVAREHNSNALEASALHFFTDILGAVVALIGLSLVYFANIHNADDIAALVLSVFVALMSLRLGKQAVDGLTDRFASAEEYAKLRTIVEETPGIEEVLRLRIRPGGPSLFVEASVAINRVLPFAAIERIIADVERSITRGYPNADVTVHWRPVRTIVEAPFDTLKVIVAEYGILPHNVELSRDRSGAVTLDYHLEFRPGSTLEEAHELCERIERKIRAELPQVTHIFAHLEEERSDRKLPVIEDVSPTRKELVEAIRCSASDANRSVLSVRSVHLLEEERFKTLKLYLTLDVSDKLTLSEAHDVVTNVEEELRKRYPEINRIVIHANPVPTTTSGAPAHHRRD